MTSTTFDPQQYKITTRAQWEDAAEAWHRWGPVIEDWLGAATERMLDAAKITNGSRVLDVAAGAGGQSLAAARRVGPAGRVLATDISPTILEYAEKSASDAGLTTITTRELDGERLDVDEASFGCGHFSGRPDLLSRSAGRLGGNAPGATTRRASFSGRLLDRRPQRILLGTGGHHSSPRPAAAAIAWAAWSVQPRRPQALPRTPLPRPVSATSRSRRCRRRCGSPARPSVSPSNVSPSARLHQMLSGLPRADRDAAWTEINQALAEFEEPDVFVGPCEMLVVSGSR